MTSGLDPVRARTYLPNLFSSLRIALAPAMLGGAYSNSKIGYIALLGVSIITDVLDGSLARAWKVETAVGQRLDHWGDALTMGMGAMGAYLLWPERLDQEWGWLVMGACAYFLIGVEKLWHRPEVAKPPPWWEKTLGLVLPLSLIPLIQGWSPWPFRAAVVLQGLLAVSECWERAPRPVRRERVARA